MRRLTLYMRMGCQVRSHSLEACDTVGSWGELPKPPESQDWPWGPSSQRTLGRNHSTPLMDFCPFRLGHISGWGARPLQGIPAFITILTRIPIHYRCRGRKHGQSQSWLQSCSWRRATYAWVTGVERESPRPDHSGLGVGRS